MSSPTTKQKKKKRGGRPALPKAQRAQRRLVARLYTGEEALLRELCAALGANETEVVRRALHALAKAEGVRSDAVTVQPQRKAPRGD